MPYGVCHFGSRSILPLCTAAGGEGCMSAQLVVPVTEGGASEDSVLWLLLLAVATTGVGAGVLLGCCCCWLCACPRQPHSGSQLLGAAARWERIVLHALRFIRRRRRIALAFGNLREWPLRSLPTPPRTSNRNPRRRRAGGPVEPLREGPAVNHGADT